MPTPNPEQQAAIDYLSGPLLVLAGPGTGKTQLLSTRVAHILEATDANADNILCLTFTDAGASNMRDRLTSVIGKAANDLHIYTYHAFGMTILEYYQNYTTEPIRRLDNPVGDVVRYKYIAEIQSKLPYSDILRTAEVKDILSTISEAKAARLSAKDLEKIARRNMEDSAIIEAGVSEIINRKVTNSVQYVVPEIYQPIIEILSQPELAHPVHPGVKPIAEVMALELRDALEEAAAGDKPSVAPLSNWRKKYFENKTTGKYRISDAVANKKLLSLAGIMEKYEAKLNESGLYDFDDMIQLAIKFLKDDEGFRLTLSEKFQYILLDEFQDTNPAQFELIKLLTDYENPLIMAVGDDDQAIYEFQGANASNLKEFQEYYHAKVVSLVKNYRSTADILATSRPLADQIENSFSKQAAKDLAVSKKLTAMLNQTPQIGAPEIARHEFMCPEVEYSWVASEIKKLISGGVNPNEIAVLCPFHKYLMRIVPYLKKLDINLVYEKRENLLDDERMHMIITISELIYNLSEGESATENLYEVLSYDFWQFAPADVLEIFSERRTKKNVVELLASHEKFADLSQFFARLAGKVRTAPFELWLNYLIGREELGGYTSPFLSYFKETLRTSELLEFYENLATFRHKVVEHITSLEGNVTAGRSIYLCDFVLAMRDYRESGAPILRISNFRDDERAVQVMTTYKSKGLEFGYVFLISFDDEAWGKGGGNQNKLVLPRNLASIRHTGTNDDELLRIIFVAMTRPKHTLIMTNSRVASDGKALHRLRYLSEGTPADDTGVSPYLPAVSQKIIFHNDSLSDEDKITLLDSNWAAKYQTFTPELEPIMRARVENYRISASDLTSFLDLRYAGPKALFNRLIMHEPPEPAKFQLIYGTLIHQVFENITRGGLSDEAAKELFNNLALTTELDHDDQLRLADYGSSNLCTALEAFGDILRSPRAKAEINLSSEHLHLNDIPLTGKIDHIEINPEDKTIEVYDFKTGAFHNQDWNNHPGLLMYRLQLGFYKLLLNLSPTYANYRVTKGHILFVTPDIDGKVYDKVYTYNQDDEAELCQLIQAVYREITTLDFVNDPEIFIDPVEGTLSMKRLNAFISYILAKNS